LSADRDRAGERLTVLVIASTAGVDVVADD
jgi:hypothetical protein